MQPRARKTSSPSTLARIYNAKESRVGSSGLRLEINEWQSENKNGLTPKQADTHTYICIIYIYIYIYMYTYAALVQIGAIVDD
jgi:hypothetical protein